MSILRIIFLDIDGVLNSFETFREIYDEYKKTGNRRVAIDEEKVLLLKEIVDRTNALLVLSSSWRKFGEMRNHKLVAKNQNLKDLINILAKYGLYIYDITPNSKNGKREIEIHEWLNKSQLDIESFIVIDDDVGDLDGFVNKELIKTSFIKTDENGNYDANKCGLTIVHVLEAIDKLSNLKTLKKRI